MASEAGITPQILYKYTDQDGAEKILSTGTLRFARPSEMNDPFDVRIDEWIAMEHRQFFEEIGPLVISRLMARPELLAAKFEMDLDAAKATIQRFQSLSEPEKAEMMNEMRNIPDAEFQRDFKGAMASTEAIREMFATVFGGYGIFCATGTFNNLLMWAHYADGHRGAVLGFRPDIENDSMLRLMTPVTYRDQRPHGIESPEEYMRVLDVPGPESARGIAHRLLHTKSNEWSYEQEWRLSIPDGIKDGNDAGFFRYIPNELEEVYLGYRMSSHKREEIIRLATNVNPDVRIFAAGLAKREYTLEFERI